jgi:hypothetical protein
MSTSVNDTAGNPPASLTPVPILLQGHHLWKDVIVGVIDTGGNFTNLLLVSTTPAVNLQLRIFRECLKKLK